MPFYLYDPSFPHVIRARTGIPADVFGLIRRIEAELFATKCRVHGSVRTYLRSVVILMVNHYSSDLDSRKMGRQKSLATRRIGSLFEFLETHYNQATYIEDATKLLNLSRPHFMRLFKYVTGQSFASYLNHFRIDKTQPMLASTGKLSAQISQEAGFCDQSHLGSVVRKIVRMRPMTYRRCFGHIASDTPIYSLEVPPNQLKRSSTIPYADYHPLGLDQACCLEELPAPVLPPPPRCWSAQLHGNPPTSASRHSCARPGGVPTRRSLHGTISLRLRGREPEVS